MRMIVPCSFIKYYDDRMKNVELERRVERVGEVVKFRKLTVRKTEEDRLT